jgi:hypothetical protein
MMLYYCKGSARPLVSTKCVFENAVDLIFGARRDDVVFCLGEPLLKREMQILCKNGVAVVVMPHALPIDCVGKGEAHGYLK